MPICDRLRTGETKILTSGRINPITSVKMHETKWSVITGAPSSGITSLGNYLRLLGFRVIPECARGLIDLGRSYQQRTKDIRADQVQFERHLCALQHQVEKSLPRDEVIFIERGLLDCEAYGLDRNEILPLHQFQYEHIFVLEQIGFMDDYARTESSQEAKQIENAIVKAYQENQYPLHWVPKDSIVERANFILNKLDLEAPINLDATIKEIF